MRPIFLGDPLGDDTKYLLEWVASALRDIELASQDDIAAIFDEYTVTNFTETRTLDATAATLSNVANFICTMVDDLKNRGTKRNQ